ncbi:MAG: AraC family transcriptional regulator [Melioribacteraceae bacterium]|nr:AraC family transcriptional regulator [Melioribacteraceae bacterium]
MIKNNFSKFDYTNICNLAEIWGLEVSSAGKALTNSNSKYPPTTHPKPYMFTWESGRVLPENAFVYITDGNGVLDTKTRKFLQLTAGDLIFIPANEWHRYKPLREIGWKEYWVTFTGLQVKKFQSNGILSQKIEVLKIGLDEDTVNLFDQMIDYFDRNPLGFNEFLISLLYKLIAHINYLKINTISDNYKNEEVIKKTKIFILENFNCSIDYKNFSKELGISYSSLRKIFKDYTKLSLLQYQINIKLHKAKLFLTQTEKPIAEISEELGFENQFYFSKFFKSKTKLAPKKWREIYKIHF